MFSFILGMKSSAVFFSSVGSLFWLFPSVLFFFKYPSRHILSRGIHPAHYIVPLHKLFSYIIVEERKNWKFTVSHQTNPAGSRRTGFFLSCGVLINKCAIESNLGQGKPSFQPCFAGQTLRLRQVHPSDFFSLKKKKNSWYFSLFRKRGFQLFNILLNDAQTNTKI